MRKSLVGCIGLAAAGLAGLAAAGGCAAPGGAERERPAAGGADRTAGDADRAAAELARAIDPFQDLGFALDWTVAPADTTGRPLAFFEAHGDRVFVHDDANFFTVRDAATGAFRWRQRLDNAIIPFVGHERIDDFRLRIGETTGPPTDVVINASRSELFVRELDTGTLLDRQRMAFLVNTPPLLIDGGVLAFGSLEGRVLFHRVPHNVYSGQFALGAGITAGLTRAGGGVGAVAADGSAAVIDPERGAAMGGVLRMFDGTRHAPVGDDRTMYVASLDQSLYAWSPANGRQRWRVRTERPLDNRLVLREGTLYLAIADRGTVAFDANSGAELWACEGVDDGYVIGTLRGELVSWDGRVASIIDPGSGELISQHELPGVARLEVQGFDDPFLYVAYDDGRLARYRPGL
jgi:hypothetical protein